MLATLAVVATVLGWICLRLMPAPTTEAPDGSPVRGGKSWIEWANTKKNPTAESVAKKSPSSDHQLPPPSVPEKMDYPPAQPPTDFGGFVPKHKSMAGGLLDTYHRCHTPGALCGHESYVDLIPRIMGDKDHDPDSWAALMEEQLKAHFDAVTSAVKVEQIHCGDDGCLIDLTQENNGRTEREQMTYFNEVRASLIDEPWFKGKFFANFEDSNFTGGVTLSDMRDNPEALWIFARKLKAAPASSP
jgi:hypothetical protein